MNVVIQTIHSPNADSTPWEKAVFQSGAIECAFSYPLAKRADAHQKAREIIAKWVNYPKNLGKSIESCK